MIVESGFIILLGFLLLFIKLPKRTIAWLLGYPLALDLVASAAAYILHFGTFSGVMAAAVAGLMTSALTSSGRWAFGYIERGKYTPGAISDWRL